MTLRSLTLVGASGAPRLETYHGREHLVVPVVALMEGVIHAVNAEEPEFVPGTRLAAAASTWNGRPLVVRHPQRNGVQISANDPDVMAKQSFGTIFKSRMNGAKLGMEAWIDPKRLEALGEHALLADIRAGKPIEVSVGASVKTLAKCGSHGGKSYKVEWDDIIGDHLAFLPGGRGACSLEMGCGACRAASAYEVTDTGMRVLFDADQPRDDSGRWEGGATELGATTPLTQENRYSIGDKDPKDVLKSILGNPKKATLTTLRKVSDDDLHRLVSAYEKLEKDTGKKSYAVQGVKHEISIRSKRNLSVNKQTLRERLASFLRAAGLGGDEEWTPRFMAATSEKSFEDKIQIAQSAISRQFNNTMSLAPNNGPWSRSTFEDHLIVSKDDKLFSVPIRWVNDDVEFVGDPSEVRMAYVAASDYDVMRAAAGARNSAADKAHIQTAHDSMVSLGAACDRKNAMRILAKYEDCPTCNGTGNIGGNPCETCDGEGEIEKKQQRSASSCGCSGDHSADEPCGCGGKSAKGDEEMKTKTERIAALMASEHNPLKDQKALETADDKALTALEAHCANAVTLKAAADKLAEEKAAADKKVADTEAALKAAQAAQIPAEELAELRALAADKKAADDAEKAELVGKLKAAGAFTEDELKGKPVIELRKLAALAKVETPDFSGRGIPRAAAAAEKGSFAPPDPYAAGVKALQQQQNTTH